MLDSGNHIWKSCEPQNGKNRSCAFVFKRRQLVYTPLFKQRPSNGCFSSYGCTRNIPTRNPDKRKQVQDTFCPYPGGFVLAHISTSAVPSIQPTQAPPPANRLHPPPHLGSRALRGPRGSGRCGPRPAAAARRSSPRAFGSGARPGASTLRPSANAREQNEGPGELQAIGLGRSSSGGVLQKQGVVRVLSLWLASPNPPCFYLFSLPQWMA